MARKLKNKNVIKNKTKLEVSKQKVPRHKEKYAALNVKRQVKTRVDQLDMDYIDQLSPAEKDWLNRFLEESVITNFKHRGKPIYKTKKKRREFYNSNNARNRCMFTKAKAMGTLVQVDNQNALQAILDVKEKNNSSSDMEDMYITALGLKNAKPEDLE
jgi:hypothetical protein